MQVMMCHEGFLVGVIVFYLSLPDKSAMRVFAQGDPAIHHFLDKAFVKKDGYAGQARV
jgi:hypothetical protein